MRALRCFKHLSCLSWGWSKVFNKFHTMGRWTSISQLRHESQTWSDDVGWSIAFNRPGEQDPFTCGFHVQTLYLVWPETILELSQYDLKATLDPRDEVKLPSIQWSPEITSAKPRGKPCHSINFIYSSWVWSSLERWFRMGENHPQRASFSDRFLDVFGLMKVMKAKNPARFFFSFSQ